MKYLLMTLAVVMMFAGPALAANGNLSQSQMAKLGLSGMTAMSDVQGNSVRGMGCVLPKVSVSGSAKVALPFGPVSSANYSATGTCYATGVGNSSTNAQSPKRI